MILNADKLKSCVKKTTCEAIGKSSPRIHCQFDNGQEFFGKNSSKSLFSWRVKGDFTLPILPILVGAAMICIASACADHARK